MPKVTYIPEKGLFQEKGEGVSITADLATDSVASLDVQRTFTLMGSPTSGVSELSGSLFILRGRDESMFFHIGGDQYVSNNAWFDADEGAWGAWKFATGSGTHSAFRWGFRSKGRFDLDVDDGGSEGATISWTTAMTVTSSNGYVAIGKIDPDSESIGSFNAQLDVSGSHGTVALAVTGAIDLGGAAEDSYLVIPRVAAQPSSPQNGMMIYNTAAGKFQVYEAGSWANII